jgi:hypothetical protein
MPVSKKRKKDKPKHVSAGGKDHKVYQDAKGDIIVDHEGKNNSSWDKINLSKKAGDKSVREGVLSVKQWHKSHKTHTPQKKG